jgi:ribosomal peptide maturation radical SAM protein 1
MIKPFLDHCMEAVSWENYAVVGFSTMFEQNMSSISLAHRIKDHDPSKIIVFGGANCEEEMGFELHRRFSFIDFVCTGEADFSFPEFLKKKFGQQPIDNVPGIIFRQNGESVMKKSAQKVESLDALPYPDFDDYFDQIQNASLPSFEYPWLPMETSRGCWWGERAQCRFCGLNPASIAFRSKSKEKVLGEIKHHQERYTDKHKIPTLLMVDNIIDKNYFKNLIPELKKQPARPQIFFEIKSNLSKEHVQMLADAGITWVQPGIESLSDHMLRLMSKGVTALQNIQLIKFCKEFGVHPTWNFLFGFPGQKIEDYKQMVELIYKIIHLPPPTAIGPFKLHRFSPYFRNPEKYGIKNVRPASVYSFVYPFESSSLYNLAYFFDFDYAEEIQPRNTENQLREAIAYWQHSYNSHGANLYAIETSPSALCIQDERPNSVKTRIILEYGQKDIYEYCDEVRSFSSIFSYIRDKYSQYSLRERDIRDFLKDMVNSNLMVCEKDKFLSLAIPVKERSSI